MNNETITPITFEEMPKAMSLMMQKLNELTNKVDLLKSNAESKPSDEWMNLKELCAYLPNHPAEQTVYGWTSTHQIPYHKRGKRIMFLKSEIDAWLNGENGKAMLQADNGSVQIKKELTSSELSKLSATLGNDALSDETKRMHVAGMVNGIVLSQQASQNFEQGMAEQQGRQESIKR